MEYARAVEFLDGGALLSYQLFHVKHSDERSHDPCQSRRSGCVAQSVRHVSCIPVPARKRSNRADVKVKANLQCWLIESGEAEELVALLCEEWARHPVSLSRVGVRRRVSAEAHQD